MGVMDRYNERKKKKNKENTGGKSASGGVAERYERNQYYQTLDLDQVDQNYIDTFATDISSFFAKVNGQSISYDDAVSTLGNLATRRDTIQGWLNKNRSNLGNEAYSSFTSAFDDINSRFDATRDFFSKFKSDEDYQASLRQYGYQQKYSGKPYEEIITVLDTLEDGEEKDWLAAYQYEALKTNADYDSRSTAGWEKYLADQEKRQKAQEESRDNESFWDKLGRWLGPAGPVDTSIPLGNAPEITHNLSKDTSYLNPNDNWTEEQKAMYGYLYDIGGEAGKYAQLTNEGNNQAENAKKIAAIEEWATQNGWTMAASTVAAIATMPLSLADTLSALTEYNARGFVSTSAAPLPGQVSNAITGAIASTLNGVDEEGDAHNVLSESIPVIGGKGWGDVYQLGTSIANSMLTAYTQGPLGTYLVFFGSASASGMYDAKSRGATDEQAVTLGILNGLAEAAGEAFSAEHLLSLAGVKEVKKFFFNLLLQAGIEASEEGVTTLLNNFADQLVMGDKSNFNILVNYYMTEKNLSEADAKKAAWKSMANDIAFDMLGGAISGGVSGGLQTGIQTIFVKNAENKKAEQIYGSDPGALVGEALEIDPNNTFAQKMQGRLDRGKNLSGSQLNRLVQQNEAALTAQDKSAIQSAAEARLTELGETGDVSAIAAALAKRFSGEKLTNKEYKLIQGSKYGRRVSTEMNPANIRSGEYASSWAENIGTERINVEEYSRLVKDAETAGETTETTGGDVATNVPKSAMLARDGSMPANDGQMASKLTGKKSLHVAEDAVSADGQAEIGGNKVVLNGLRENADGSVVVATADDQTADPGDVKYPSKGHALVYENYANIEAVTDNPVLANMDVDSRSLLARAYDPAAGVKAEDYFLGSNLAFQYGFEGIPMNERTITEDSLLSSITKAQRDLAYDLGRKAGKQAAETQEAGIHAAYEKAVEKLGGKGAAKAVAKKNPGKVVLRNGIVEETMKEKQKAAYELAKTVSKATGVTINIYRGMREHGKYNPATGEIWLNINSNISGSSMMAFTLAHELVHMAKQWKPADFKVFADYLFEQYGKKGVSVEGLIQNQMEKAKDNGYTLNEHEAYEEVIADTCQRMLLDGDALQKMAAYKEKNPSTWQKIVNKIREFITSIRNLFMGAEPDSMEAELYKTLDEDAKQFLEKLFVDMVMGAGEHMSTIRNAFGKGTVVEVNADGEFTLAKGNVDGATKFLYNDSTWENGGRDTLEAALKAEGFSKEDVNAALTIMDGKHKLVKDLAKQFPEQGRINQATITTDLKDGHSVLSALVSNGDYPVNIDLLMVCKKRKAYQRVINRLCETGLIQQATVDALAIAEINKILGKYGFETACLGCFVESRRLRIQEWANTIVKEWNSEVKKRTPDAKAFGFGKGEGKLTPDEVMQLIGELETGGEKNDQGNLNLGQGSAVKRMGVLLDKVPSLRKTLSVEDLITPDGLTALREFDSNLFSMVKSRYGSNSPKFVQEFNPYNHELAKYGKVPSEYENLRDYLYAIGGARMQSFSDFIVENWFDYCQIVADLAARKLPMHTYTKEITLAKLFGQTGIKINMSLIPDIDRSLGKEYAGLTRNEKGELELIWADKDRNKATGGKSYMQSINFADAIALQNDPRYSANVGTIAVGVSDKHIYMMLDDARIRMVIPYHSSGMNPIFADLMGTSYYKDYTMFQNTTVKQLYNSKGQPVSMKLDKIQTGKLTSGFQFNEVLQELGDARAAAQAYKDWCADSTKHSITIKGETYTAELTPKFDNFSWHDNYYKLLEDFNTYDCISEEAAPQGDVQQNYPEDFDQILKAELTAQENHRQKQVESQAFDKAMGEIETYLQSHTKADTVFYAEQHGVKLSAKDKKLGAEDKKKLADLRNGEKYSMPRVKAPTFYSQMAKVVEGVKQNKLGASSVVSMLRGKGVKAEEIKWSGIEEWLEGKKSVTKAELQEFIAGSQLQIEVQVRDKKEANNLEFKQISSDTKGLYSSGTLMETFTESENGRLYPVNNSNPGEWYFDEQDVFDTYVDAANNTRWSEYKLGGGKNYREYVFKLPSSTYSNDAMIMHWGEKAKGVLAHARLQDFRVKGKKMLFVEEIQSDWHNQGGKHGYKLKGQQTDVDLYNESGDAFREFLESDVISSIETRLGQSYYDGNVSSLISDLFDGKEYALDEITYHLGKLTSEEKAFIDKVVAEEAKRRNELLNAPRQSELADKAPDAPFKDTYHEYVMKSLLREAAEQGYDSIGWTTAEIQSERWSDEFAEGYRIEYDQDIPKFLNKYGKKWGATVGKTKLKNGTEVWSMPITDSMKESVLYEGQPKYSMPKVKTDSASYQEPAYQEWDVQTALYDALDHADNGRDHLIKVGNMPKFVVDLLGIEGDFYIYRDHSYDNMVTAEQAVEDGRFDEDSHYHGLGVETMVDAIMALEHPIMTIATKTDKGNPAVIMLLPVEGKKETPLYAILSFYSKKDINGDYSRKPHIVLSVFEKNIFKEDGREGIADVIRNAVREKRVISFDKKMRDYLTVKTKEASLGIISEQSLADNLSQFLKEIKSFKEKNRIFYKIPNSHGMSPRQLLADAFDGLVQTPDERELMDRYRKNITKVEEAQERLDELRGEISRLTKAKGDKGEIAALNREASELVEQIDKYDRELLKLEASKPLKDVLARARSAAYQKAKQRSEKNLKEYRQQVSERFSRGVEGRRKTEMRRKIRKTIRDLDKILNRGDKKRNVKEDMKDFVAEALSAAEVLFTDNYTNEDMIRNGFGVELSKEETRYMEEVRGILEEMSNLPAGSYESWYERQEIEEKLKSRLAYRMGKLKDAFFRERQRLNKTEVAEVLSKLADSYAKLENSEYAYVNGAYHESVHAYLKMLQEDVGGAKVKDMTLGQLEELYKAYTMVLTTVQNANKMFSEDLKLSKEQLANRVMMEVHKAGGEHGLWSKGELARNQASWNNTKPIYAAERTGSPTFVKLVNGLFKGQYNWAVDMDEAKAYRQKVSDKYGFKSWDMEKTYKFTSSSGIDFELNLNQIMALYAYAKREQAHDHLLKGGFVFGKNTEVVVTKNGIKRTYLNKSAKAHNISDEIMGEIIGKLTDKQKGFVDEMQDYLSTTMGNKGNEVSMRLYGVKLFMEKFYFPLRSAGQFKEKAKEAEMKQQQGQISIANSGFTHSTTPKASNPVVLDGFTDVWASHVNEMSLYHSMVLPMEDFRRVYNYASPNMEGQESASVNSFIENAYGDAATGYFDQLYKELNGGAIVDPRENIAKQRIGKFKKAAVMLSNSVWVQQFSAIGRAYALVDPKYFIGPKVDKKRHAALWEEVKQYAPVAIIKEMGGFDTHTGLSAKDYLLAEEYGKGERIKGFFQDKQYRDEIMGLLPAKADELTWCSIWEAVKRETQAKNPKMDLKSEEFLKKAGERFSEVIEKTQVYDSVLARSANMRSKNALMQMLTAFMAEPTTTVNMVEDAMRKGNKKTIARTFGAVAATIILNNALVSIVYAMRDDDEDETMLEKYFQAFTSGMLDDINPMTYYPVLKDIWSLFQGYDIERSDMAIYSDISDSVKKLVTQISKYDSEMDEDDAAEYYKEIGDALLQLLDAGAAAFGVPLRNVRRDLMSYYNTIKNFAGGDSTTWNSFVDAVGGSALDSIPIVGLISGESKQDKLYDAIISGDKAYADRLKGGYKDQNAINNAIRKGLRENDPRIRKAAIAWNADDLEEYMSIAKEIIAEKLFVQDDVVMAIRAEASALAPDAETATTSKAKGLFTAENFAEAISQGKMPMADAIKTDIIKTAMQNGKTEEEAEKSFRSAATTGLKELFLSGDVSESQAIDALETYCDKTKDEAMADVQYWAFKQEYPDVYADDQWFDTYYEKVADSGLDIEVYMEYRNTVSTITGEGKKDRRMSVIHNLPISSRQKDALYLAEGWAESKLYEAPWH